MGDYLFDAHRVGSKLWVGSCPLLWGIEAPDTLSKVLQSKRFDLVVLCAKELQKELREVSLGVPVLEVPLDDSEITRGEYRRAIQAASFVTKKRRQNQRVLVTCQMGVNRSSLVAAMSLILCERLSAEKAVEQIQKYRKPAIRLKPLGNKSFVSALYKLENLLARSRQS